MNRYQFYNFFILIYKRIRGPVYKIGHVIPYYGGATSINHIEWNKEYGWCYGFESVKSKSKFAASDKQTFTESLVKFYLDHPGKDGRHYGYRNKG